MQIPAVSDQVSVDWSTRVAKRSQDAAKATALAAVQLITQSGESVPPLGEQGQGARINTYG